MPFDLVQHSYFVYEIPITWFISTNQRRIAYEPITFHPGGWPYQVSTFSTSTVSNFPLATAASGAVRRRDKTSDRGGPSVAERDKGRTTMVSFGWRYHSGRQQPHVEAALAHAYRPMCGRCSLHGETGIRCTFAFAMPIIGSSACQTRQDTCRALCRHGKCRRCSPALSDLYHTAVTYEEVRSSYAWISRCS